MSLSAGEIIQRTAFLGELLHCNESITLSKYNVTGTLIETTASTTIYDTFLRYSNRLTDAVVFGENSSKPVIITVDAGLMWSVVFEKDDLDQLTTLHVMGPIFSSAISENALADILKKPGVRIKWRPKLETYLRDVPVVPATNFFNYTLMLHYAVHEEYLKPSDITFLDFNNTLPRQKNVDYARFYALETQMADFIRNGDIHYKGKIKSAASIMSELQPLSDANPSLAKQLSVAFCALCIRAAIEGGVSSDAAYLKGGAYLENIATANSFASVISICNNAFQDFLFQVHNHQNLPRYSAEIMICVDYIETHTEDELGIELLANVCGYTSYYLSKKFKAEVGMSINSYIKKARIEKAQHLMVTTKMSIQEISDLLHFGNRNFFTKVFKEVTGQKPAEFRRTHTLR